MERGLSSPLFIFNNLNRANVKCANAYFKEKGDSYSVDATWFILHPNRDQTIGIGDLIDSGRVKPVVDTILLLSLARQAYEGAEGVHEHGKIVLRVK
jgi:NADPH:quinone reductase-like Zn-dependent oxidoreductase